MTDPDPALNAAIITDFSVPAASRVVIPPQRIR
jgi:hypothetical protein